MSKQFFLNCVGVSTSKLDVHLCPQVLCEASAALVQKHGVKLPPAPDVGCFRNAAGAGLILCENLFASCLQKVR